MRSSLLKTLLLGLTMVLEPGWLCPVDACMNQAWFAWRLADWQTQLESSLTM